jgi:light-regulated signal transduction histidine kinase (bacteriophytochrome)
MGINSEDFPRLMKFTQLDSQQIKEYSGKWAELTLARRLIELHGGKFWVESRFGKGNRFGFLIPIATGKHETKAELIRS